MHNNCITIVLFLTQVDAEIREAFPLPPSVSSLSMGQRDILESCASLEIPNDGSSIPWKLIKSPSPFINMWTRYLPPVKSGERLVGTGKTVGTIDCSPREVLAWWWDYSSRKRQRLSNDQGNPARIVVRELTPNDVIVATIKKFSFPIVNREFVGRNICATQDSPQDSPQDSSQDSPKDSPSPAQSLLTEQGPPLPHSAQSAESFPSYVFVNESADVPVDYGETFSTVTITSRGIARFEPVPGSNNKRCEISYYQYFDSRGNVPKRVVDRHIPRLLKVLVDARSDFETDAQFDVEERAETAQVIATSVQPYDAEETSIMERVAATVSAIDFSSTKPLDSPDFLVAMKMKYGKKSGDVELRAVTVLDATIEVSLAKEISKMARVDQVRHNSKGGLERQLVKINDHSSVFHFARRFPGFKCFKSREFLTRFVWKWSSAEKNELRLYYSPIPSHEGIPDNSRKYVRVINFTQMVFKKLPPRDGLPQTSIEFTATAGFGAGVPQWMMARSSKSQLMYLSEMRKYFDRSLDVDRAVRVKNVAMIRRHAETAVYTEAENRVLEVAIERLGMFLHLEGDKKGEARVGSEEHIVSDEGALTVEKLQLGDVGINRAAWGYASTVVQANSDEILAWVWDMNSRTSRKATVVEMTTEESPNEHNFLAYYRGVSGVAYVADRDFLTRTIWKKTGDGCYLFASEPEESERRGPVKGVIRGTYPSALRISKLSAHETKLDYVIHPDAGGNVPTWFMNAQLRTNLAYMTQIREYFQALKKIEHWNVRDGRTVGEALVLIYRKGRSNAETAVKELFSQSEGLTEVGLQHYFFEEMLVKIVSGRPRPTTQVRTSLCNLSKKEGRDIGQSFAILLASHSTGVSAADDFIGMYPALIEIDKEYVWFRGMLEEMATLLLHEVSPGVKLRAFVGAALSMSDLASDLYMINFYYSIKGQERFGLALLIMLCTTVTLQMLVTLSQHRSDPKRMIVEVLFCITGTKSG